MPVPKVCLETNMIYEHIQKEAQAKSIGHFELEEFDKLIGGINRGRLTVLCAEPGLSKTSLFVQLADEAALAGFMSVFNTLEIPASKLAIKSIARYSNGMLTLADICNPEKQDIVQKVTDFYYEAIAPNMAFIEQKFNPIELGAILDQLRDEYGKQPILFVDYLQIMPAKSDKFSSDERLIVKENIEGLRHIANTYDVPIFVISSINRQNYNKAPSLSALGASSSIEYAVDTVIYMNVPGRGDERETNMNKSVRPLELTALKNRYGQNRTINLSFDCPHATFTSGHSI